MSKQNAQGSASDGSLNDIAIIGMSGRFPGASDLSQYWQNLKDGVESISFFTPQEVISSGVDPSVVHNPNYVRAGGILEDIDMFDASFFGYNPREAESMDPQQRLFLECAWHALEDAAYDPESYRGVIGVYAGCSMSTYAFQLYGNPDFVGLVGHFQILIGNDKDYLATRTSYKLNLKGPSISIQTACSTSLVAVSQACQSLLNHQCDMALAGGVTVRASHKSGYFYQREGIYSPDGHCRAFDAKAQGTVFGNGVGVLVLKRLAEAIADGDHIYAVIKGSAVNNDGSVKVGYTAPSLEGQAEVIAMAQSFAGVNPETITYIETHGTGTALGDPIEIEALTQAFRAGTAKKNFCAIGSVKTNLGHLDSAAGAAGLIKAVLSLKNKMLPPSLHFEEPNPGIDFTNSPFYVNTKLSKWKTGKLPRRAGVSAFGIGGTNAHVVLEEAPASEKSGISRPAHLVMISAKTGQALDTATVNLARHLRQHPELNLADVAYSCQVGRKAFNHRRLILSHSLEEAASALETGDPRRVFSAVPASREKPAVFMFSGQGAQYADMGLGLYQDEPAFREQVDRCSEALEPHLGFDLRRVLYPCPEKAEDAAQQLKQTAVTQPALFVIEYALAKLFMEWGVHPQAMIGHSIGEYVAACLAGVFSLEDILALIAERGRLMQELSGGSMLAVPLPVDEIQTYLNGQLSIAAVNEPSLCVVSGPTEAVEQFEAKLAGNNGIVTRRLHTSHAFHSAMMNPILTPFAELVGRISLRPPQIPFVSNVTGSWITTAEATSPAYWANHIRHCVRFADGLQTLFKDLDSVLLEIGPGQSLSTFARRHPQRPSEQIVLSTMHHPHDRQEDIDVLLKTTGQLWLAGVPIDWSGFYARERRRRIPLPGYPFQRQRYWVEPAKPKMSPAPAVSNGKNADLADWFYVPSWKRAILPERRAEQQKSRWLIFEDPYGPGSQMTRRLEQDGEDVIRVRLGDGFARKGENDFEMDPGEAGHYHALLKELRLLDRLPDRIVHFWSVTPNDPLLFEQAQKLGFYSLLFLAQALGDQAPNQVVQMGVISNQIQSVTGEEELSPQKATLLGPCKVIPQEYPNITCRSIDLHLPKNLNEAPERLIDSLVIELRAKASEAILAYRGNQYWVQTFERVRLERSAEEALPLRMGGVYLITGGLGGMGLEMARTLAQATGARLALVGRSSFLERDRWEGWLPSHDAANPISRKIRAVQAIEELGGQVLVLSANVADREQMQQALRKVHERFGRVHGVIHAAGVAGGGIIQMKTPEEVERVMAPKVQGALVLDALFKEAPLDFFVSFSSLTSLLGGAGQVDYCGANAFLDAFAYRQDTRDSRLLLTINWDTWQEAGMAVNTEVPRHLEAWRQEMLRMGILSSEGTDAFMRVLHTTAPQIAISPRDIRELMERNGAGPTPPAPDEQQAGAISTARHSRPEIDSPYIVPRNRLEQELATIWQEILGVEKVGVNDHFFADLNGHSLLATQLMSRLRSKFHLEIPLQRFFEGPTIAELASAIEVTGEASQHGSEEPPLVPVRRDKRRGVVTAEGVLQVSEELKKDLSG